MHDAATYTFMRNENFPDFKLKQRHLQINFIEPTFTYLLQFKFLQMQISSSLIQINVSLMQIAFLLMEINIPVIQFTIPLI